MHRHPTERQFLPEIIWLSDERKWFYGKAEAKEENCRTAKEKSEGRICIHSTFYHRLSGIYDKAPLAVTSYEFLQR